MSFKVVGPVAGAALALAALATNASAATKTVYAGGPAGFAKSIQKHYGAAVNGFLNPTVTIHQGDSVKWVGLSKGFHSVDLPGPAGSDLPIFAADPAHPVAGVKDAAGAPFWFNGLPSVGLNAVLAMPSGGNAYDGTKRVDSGLPVGPPVPSYTVKFTKAGTYRYFCDTHYGMQGTVRVVAAHASVPSAAADARALARIVARDTASAKRLDRTRPPTGTVQLGASDAQGVEVFAMFPAKLTVKVGTTVTFAMSAKTREAHTASFGDTSKAGLLAMLSKSFQSPTPDPRAVYASDPPPAPIALSPTTHGNGFASTGLLDQDPATPLPPSGRITFTAPGTYGYMCLIHPFMRATVTVQ